MRTITLGLFLTLGACHGTEGDADAPVHPGEPYIHLRTAPTVTDSSSPEHRFLDHMIAHEQTLGDLLRRAGARHLSPPARTEIDRADSQRIELEADLRGAQRLYLGGKHPPETPSVAANPGESIETSEGAVSERRVFARIVQSYRQEVAAIDSFLPRLTASEVGTLARRIRVQRIQEITRLTRGR